MNTKRFCLDCGAELSADDAQGLCPRCLLKVGLGSQPGPPALALSPEPRALPQPGATFGRYRIVRALGQGGMGVVYEAQEEETGRRVALKVLGQQLDSPQDRARFLREGRLAASINHPNCVYVYGTEEIDGTPTISMELVAGGTLQNRVRNHGPLPVSRAVDAILQIIAGLEAAQVIGILHRDIKPGNCFEDADGTVKIGDFGLSISTAARAETNLTVAGTMVGTPAFCSPEQLRGEELNPRSDMYSVGVTLYYLLTGRTPFEGHTVAQLIANALEKTAPSPRAHRAEIPRGLAGAILRCLKKHPSDRFKDYAELRQALSPYSSIAPTPATLGLRFLAGALDQLIVGMAVFSVLMIEFGDPMGFFDVVNQGSYRALAWMFGGLSFSMLYFAVSEGRWGASPGKAICRLRVVGPDNSPPGLRRALGRAFIYGVLPALPFWIISGGDPASFLRRPAATQYIVQILPQLVIAALFCTMRRRNGFAAVHDLVTRTRVISQQSLQARPVVAGAEAPPAAVDAMPRVGPYHVLHSLGQSDGIEWLLGYDLRLLRKVWVRVVPPGTPPVLSPARNLGRIGRLRWLTGRRSPEESWDAFEGVGGQPLLALVQTRQTWSQVRFWLHDLARELSSAEKDGTLPALLALDRVWITGEGRAKLLDFRAPGLAPDAAGSPAATLPCVRFLGEVARAALEGASAARGPAADQVAVPLPLHARRFLHDLPQQTDAEAIVVALRPLLSRLATITRRRRAATVAGCLALPLFGCIAMILGTVFMKNWEQKHPGLLELSGLLQGRSSVRFWGRPDQLPSDRLYSVFIATHYQSVITNEASWSSPIALAMIKGETRRFAEQALKDPAPVEKEIAEADAALKPHARAAAFPDYSKQPWILVAMVGVILVIYVAFPALVAALLFRGGLILAMANLTFVRKDGARASRLRVFWRALVTWSPVIASLLVFALLKPAFPMLAYILAGGLVAGPAILSVALPGRGLADRLAGTWPVPR